MPPLPTDRVLLGLPGRVVFALLVLAAILAFAYSLGRRVRVLLAGADENRFDRIGTRIVKTLEYAFLQKRMFRDLYAGTTPMRFDPADPVGSVVRSGLWVVGTPEQVRDQYVELWRQLPAEYVVLIYHWAQQPAESVVRQLELFMEHVKPALDEMTPYEA